MISGIVTALLLACFLVGIVWAFSSKRRAQFEEAARIPLEDEMPVAPVEDRP